MTTHHAHTDEAANSSRQGAGAGGAGGGITRYRHAIHYARRQELFDLLMDQAGDRYANSGYLAQMIASHCCGDGVMSTTLGLEKSVFSTLLARFFNMEELPVCDAGQVAALRCDEQEELVTLMLAHRAGVDTSEVAMAHIVANACMGADHLWQDMGLWSRVELSTLIELNFPALSAKNHRNMKWKKFLYKQLCEAEGIYICRSPSCEVCAEYPVCFAPEV